MYKEKKKNGATRVGIVIDQLSYGGAERQVVELAIGLLKHSLYFPIVICYTNLLVPFGNRLMDNGVLVVTPNKSLQKGLPKILWIRKNIQKYNCKIVYAILNTPNIYCWLSCTYTSSKYIGSVRNVPNLCWPLHFGLKFALKYASAIIANSPSGKRWAIESYDVNSAKITVVPNAVEVFSIYPNSRAKLRGALGIGPEDWVVGTVANIKAQKQPGFFLEVALEMIKNIDLVIRFVWVGDGPLWMDVENKLKEFPQEVSHKIHFPGAKENIREWYAVFDIFILTSAWEGLPNALMEAMAAGLPCAATDVPGTCDLMEHGYNGILLPNNTNEFARNLHALLKDNNLQRKLGQNAKEEMYMKYGSNQLINKTVSVFNSTLKG